MHAGAGMSRAAVERVPSLMRVVAATGTDDRATRRAFSVARSGTVLDGVGKRNALSVMPRAFRTRPGGLEPPTFGFVDRCSIQLSYGRVSVCIAAGGGEMIAKISPDGMGAIRAEIHVIYAQPAQERSTEMCRFWGC